MPYLRLLISSVFLFGLTALPLQAATSTTSIIEQPAVLLQESYERGIIEKVSFENQKTTSTGQVFETYQVQFLSGPFKNQTKFISGDIDSNPFGFHPKVGDKVVIFVQSDDTQTNFFIQGFDRRAAIIWLVVLFVLTLVFLSGWQGAKVAASIGISILLIGYVLIPLFLNGANPVPIAIVLSGVLTLISTGMSTGWNKKAIVTAVGTMGGAIMAYIIALIFADWAHLGGLSSEEDRLFFDKNPHLNPRGLLFAGIIIASMGVVEDVAVSIVSGVSEVKRHKPQASFKELFSSGMVVGKDHMGALANTLVFAYVGGSLSTLLLYQQFKSSWLKFINFDSVVDEIIRSLAGTIGLVFTVPITALLAAWVLHREKHPTQESHRSHSHFHHH